MTYLFSNTVSVSNEVEVKNDANNALPITGNVTIFTLGSAVNATTNRFPVDIGSNNITITGNVNIIPTINVASSPDNPVHVHLTEVGTFGNLTSYVPIQGNVNVGNNFIVHVDNFPDVQTVNGSVYLSNSFITVTGNVTANGIINIGNFPSTQTVNGTINIGNTIQANVINFPTTQNVNVQNTITVNQGTNPWTVTGNVVLVGESANVPPQIMFADTIQMDTTDRLRTSIQGQQWWYVPAIDKDGDLRIQEKFQGANATSTFIQNLAAVRLTSGQYYSANTQLTGTAIRASRRRHKTRPGVSQEWIGVINWDGLQNNVVKRSGLFTKYNGAFFEATGTSVNVVVRRRLTDGTLVEDRIPYTSWNKDTMNGSGPSGYNWQAANITANVTSVYSKTDVAIPGDGTVYQVTYQMPTGQESIIPVGKKVTITGLTPTGFNDTGLITSIDTVNHRMTVAYVADPGTYVSASNAKMTNTPFHQIHNYWFDMSGARTARIRFGIYTDAGKVCVHEYKAGEIGSQIISAPAMMDRKEIINVGQPVDFLPSMTICASGVTIETTADISPGFGVAQSNVAITFNKNTDVNKEYALIGIGIREGEPYQRADIQVQGIQMVDIGNINPQNAGIIQWRLVLNPTVSAVPTPRDIGKATHMWDYAQGTTITGGIDLIGGYSQGSYTSDVRTALNFLNMGSNIDYTDSDIVVLAAKLIVGGTDHSQMLGTISYLEDL